MSCQPPRECPGRAIMAEQSRVGYEFAQPPAAVPHKRRAPYRDPLMPPPMCVMRCCAARARAARLALRLVVSACVGVGCTRWCLRCAGRGCVPWECSEYASPHRIRPARTRSDAPANIMFDKRVVRGNTYAAQVLPPVRSSFCGGAHALLAFTHLTGLSLRCASVPQSAQAEAERRQIEAEQRARRRELEAQTRRDNLDVPRTPSPVDGRRHIDVQTENYLEELSDRVPEVEEATQTEAFMDRPPSPLFIPTKTGLDKETQILPGDLFDFDLEVEPILEVLVGKTLEQGLMEVLEEEELENIRKHQEEFEQVRNAELAEVQRLEEEVKRKDGEKVRIASAAPVTAAAGSHATCVCACVDNRSGASSKSARASRPRRSCAKRWRHAPLCQTTSPTCRRTRSRHWCTRATSLTR